MLDQVGAQRGSERKKIFSMYYSWMSMMFNRAWLSGKIGGLEYKAGNTSQAIAVMAKAAFFGWGMQAVNEIFWRELVRNTPEPDEEARKKRALITFGKQPFGYVLVVRDIVGFAIENSAGSPNASFKFSPLESAAQSVVEPFSRGASIGFSDHGEYNQRYAEGAARAAAILVGYPQSINTMAFNFLDWSQGEGDFTWRDILTRRTKK